MMAAKVAVVVVATTAVVAVATMAVAATIVVEARTAVTLGLRGWRGKRKAAAIAA